MTTYRAEVTWDDRWWMVRIPELDLLTQAETWDEVELMARDVIACMQDIDIAEVAVTIAPLDATSRVVASIESLESHGR